MLTSSAADMSFVLTGKSSSGQVSPVMTVFEYPAEGLLFSRTLISPVEGSEMRWKNCDDSVEKAETIWAFLGLGECPLEFSLVGMMNDEYPMTAIDIRT
jgi:hypothetical protein